MRKFLMNGSVLSSLFSVVPLVKRTRASDRNWVVVLMWVGWLITVVVAVVAVIDQADDEHNGEIDT